MTAKKNPKGAPPVEAPAPTPLDDQAWDNSSHTSEELAAVGEAPSEPDTFEPINEDDTPDYDAEHSEEDE